MLERFDERLEVVAISDHEWRVCDRRIPDADSRRVLGFIEELGSGYDALALTPLPVPCGVHRAWDAALRAISERSSALSSDLAAPAR